MHSAFSPKKTKIFYDGADRASMLEMAKNPMIQGFTTNPTLMKKSGVRDYRAFSLDILKEIPDRPISFELFADEFDEMRRQAMEIHSWGENVYVKVPITNTEGQSSLPLVRELTQSGVKLNVTALLTLQQVVETCAALKSGAPSIVSVFAGRIADTGLDPMPLMRAAVEISHAADPHIELLWASTREVLNVAQAQDVGCDIITVAPDLLKKLSMFGKDLRQLSLETVRMFKSDAEAAGFTL